VHLQAEIAAFFFHEVVQQALPVASASKNPVHKEPVDLRQSCVHFAVQRKGRDAPFVCLEHGRFKRFNVRDWVALHQRVAHFHELGDVAVFELHSGKKNKKKVKKVKRKVVCLFGDLGHFFTIFFSKEKKKQKETN
jgi:hypothetical protein